MNKNVSNVSIVSIYRLGIIGSIFIVIGTIFPSLFAISLRPKQPPWENVEVFVEHYHNIQSLPFYFGFFLIGGSIMLLTAIYLLSKAKLYPVLGLIFGIIGASIVVLNYIIQTTYVPAMVAEYTPSQAIILKSFTMANPTSFAWALEMWGYGFIGLATLLAAVFFKNKGIEMTTKILFFLNGILSIGAAFYTAIDLGWVLTTPGYISFGLWNILYLLLAVMVIKVFLIRKNDTANL
ncbi:MAG: hypothetical protein R6V23_01840 [Bacteroidales bacterium]